jgi:hypothetical protein
MIAWVLSRLNVHVSLKSGRLDRFGPCELIRRALLVLAWRKGARDGDGCVRQRSFIAHRVMLVMSLMIDDRRACRRQRDVPLMRAVATTHLYFCRTWCR